MAPMNIHIYPFSTKPAPIKSSFRDFSIGAGFVENGQICVSSEPFFDSICHVYGFSIYVTSVYAKTVNYTFYNLIQIKIGKFKNG